jgi:predicted AAA+ superfamily ATPase
VDDTTEPRLDATRRIDHETSRSRNDYRRRVVDGELDELMPELAAIAVDGAHGVGKTATALQRAATSYRLDDPGQLAIARADPTRLTRGSPPVLIDEWQRIPEAWDLVRREVDAHAAPGRFLLTGSAPPLRPPTHSGAGRIVRLRMRPMSVAERGLEVPTVSLRELLTGSRRQVAGATRLTIEEYVETITASGFPGLLDVGARARRTQLDGYLEAVIDRDLDEAGYPVRDPAGLRRWMAAYAAATASTASYETIRDAATPGHRQKPARETAQRYVAALERLWIVDPVPAWAPSGSHLGRLGSAPRHHLADPALAARLLGVGADGLLEGRAGSPPVQGDRPLLAALFESLVTQAVRVFAQAAEARTCHFRTRNGDREVDLIVERDDRKVVALKVKLARTIEDADVRHLAWLQARLGPRLLDAVIVSTGPEAYRRADGVAVVPAALLGP